MSVKIYESFQGHITKLKKIELSKNYVKNTNYNKFRLFCIKRVFFLNMKLIMTIIYLLFNVKINNLKKKIHWSNEIN